MDIFGSPEARLQLRVGTVAVLVGLLAVAGTGVLARLAGVSNEALTREPQAVLEGAWYIGALSNLGAIVWAVAAVSAALTATVVHGRERTMFAAAGAFSSLLLADDLFLLHDAVFPKVGLSESIVQAAYLVVLVVITAKYRREMGLVAVGGVALTLGFWGASVGMDTLFNNAAVNLDQLVEDGLKFLGIVVWAAVWGTLSHLALVRTRREAHAPA